ncbi:hypothetical protein [Tellurirhabdus rosea]|uniref:hypothetical protein n=1 Tax=Tellurirhabdus rosea TaxID=2674997 RepID=UPI0022548C3E|nr:hypothetical protein [Tellurirhabdus rosea]
MDATDKNLSNKPDFIDFYKEVYYKELDRRNSLNTEIALQATTLVAIVSSVFSLLTNLKSSSACLHFIFAFLTLGETVIAVVAVYYLMRSYYDFIKRGRRFRYLPKMEKVHEYYEQVDGQEFNSFLRDYFIAACDSHITHNDHKSVLLTKSSRWMTYLVMGGGLIALIFIVNYVFDNPNLKTTSNNAVQEPKKPATAPTRTPL